MKVTFVIPGRNRAGGIKSTVKAANGLLHRGHQVRLLVNKKTDLWSRCRMLWLAARYTGNDDWVKMFEGKVEMFGDITKCRFEDSEIVVASGEFAATQLLKIKNQAIIKVHHIRGVGFRDRIKMNEIWGENVPKIVIASFLKNVIKEVCGQEVLAVVPNGIDTNEYFPSVQENQRNGVGTIFGMAYQKDPQTILGVLKELRRTRPEITVRVFGACHRPKEISRRIYNRLPSVEMAREIYSRSLVWFLGSRSEGFSVPILEAMACGCAVVATDCGGPRDIITDGENGFLVKIGDVNQIVQRVEQLLNNHELRKKLVKKSQETVQSFSWENSVSKLEDVLMKVSGKR